MDKIHIVILTWNSEKVIGACIDSLLAFRNLKVDIHIVDNGSIDNTLEVVTKRRVKGNGLHTLTVTALERNTGTTVSRNMALREILKGAQAEEYICVLDSDTQVGEEAIKILIDELNRCPQNGVVGPQMLGMDGKPQLSGREIPTVKEKLFNVLSNRNLQKQSAGIQENGTQPVGYLLSACWLMKASLFEQVGLLDERIFYAPEDVEFCIRVWKKGFRVVYCPDAKILHHWQRISRKKLFSKHNYEHIKGLIYMFLKHRYCFSNVKIQALIF